MKLDERDHRLLSILSRDAAITNRELARRIGLSPSACLTRVKRLETNGLILGYRAVVREQASLGRVEAWVDIRLLDPNPQAEGEVARLIRTNPDIVEAHRVAGHYDYIVRFCSADAAAWSNFKRSLDALGYPASSNFSILMNPLK